MESRLKNILESLYATYNRRQFVNPDPLLFLYDYPDVRDREVAGLLAACLAYGRVELIMKTVAGVLDVLGPAPARTVSRISRETLEKRFRGFKYRFATETHLCCLIMGIRRVVRRFGSLEACFMAGLAPEDETVLPGLAFLYRYLDPDRACGHLLADPSKTSACKRHHLFLRWMVRQDAVDPGGWHHAGTERLIIPLDTHMYKAGHLLGFTGRKSADRAACFEITRGFRRISPRDPVRYDFCLTRFGIQRRMGMDALKEILETRGKEGLWNRTDINCPR